MSSFVISYVPTVEDVLLVEQVDNVSVVQDVKKVDEVVKLPHPYYPLRKYNYQSGGMLHIPASANTYQAVYVPNVASEFKSVHLSFTSYNIEDTYDVWVGARKIINGSHVKEMSEYRQLEVYEDVGAGTPIVIEFHNNSGLEKYLAYEFITLVDEAVLSNTNVFHWNFYWDGSSQKVGGGVTNSYK